MSIFDFQPISIFLKFIKLTSLYKQNRHKMFSQESFPVFNLDLDCQFESSDQKFNNLRKQINSHTFSIEDGSITAFSTIGKRNSNLDTFSYLQKQHYTYLAIFDGHGDDKVSKFLESQLLKRLVAHSQIGSNPQQALLEVLNRIEEQVIENYEKGSTVLVVIIDEIQQKIIVANIGDCKLFGLKKTNGQLMPLTKQHNLSNQFQVSKIMEKGGLIFKRGAQYRINGELNISRSIGDKKHKHYMSSQPQFYTYNKSDFKKLILATDGFYQHLLFEQQLCKRSLKEIQKKVKKGCQGYGFDDNATVLCIRFKNSEKNSLLGSSTNSFESSFGSSNGFNS